jgi:hypothetical protein
MKEKRTLYLHMKEIDGIFYMDFIYENLTIEIVKNIISERLEFTNYKKSYFFVDGTRVKNIDKKSRDFFGSKAGTYLVGGMAIYSNSKLSTFLANFLVNVNLVRYNIPIKVFTDKEEAIQWVKNIKAQHG